MRKLPIPFTDAMVAAILAGRKTQTRRILDPQPKFDPGGVIRDGAGGQMDYIDPHWIVEPRPRYAVGDLLWVCETFCDLTDYMDAPAFVNRTSPIAFRADDEFIGCHKWKPSTNMPRHLSRITLWVTGVKVERLQSISEADAKAEGAPGWNDIDFPNEVEATAKEHFRLLWKSINGPGSWEANPWVVAIEFHPIFQNIDKVAAQKEPTPC